MLRSLHNILKTWVLNFHEHCPAQPRSPVFLASLADSPGSTVDCLDLHKIVLSFLLRYSELLLKYLTLSLAHHTTKSFPIEKQSSKSNTLCTFLVNLMNILCLSLTHHNSNLFA
ncbi:hypothetical protein NPIL_43951 [Nephila pilipes]|uniref:Uncharacterized protein n=1 Tax=Nephila pilipes TaxID=299642 RepID=A0A8X6IP84_NEPPI|nr:hypothetical protein NPIL_43951 [Nephila pilipes]